jgi:hypothetical protein
VVTPPLKVLVPTKLIPEDDELPDVAPLITHVSVVTPQLSAVFGLRTVMLLLQPDTRVSVTLPGQLTVGRVVSLTVNVVVQVFKLPEASFTVIVTFVTPVPTSVPANGDCVFTS